MVRVDGDHAAGHQHGPRSAGQGPVRRRRRGAGDVRRRRDPHSRPPAREQGQAGAQEPQAPRSHRPAGRGAVPSTGIEINAFEYSPGGYAARRGVPADLMRPPTIQPGQTVTFTNLDATQDMPDLDQGWHSITSCKAPCNRGSGIGYPLARGPIKFDSGQLGFDSDRIDFSGQTSVGVTTDSNVYTTPPLTKPGEDLHVLLPDPPVHARVDPGQGSASRHVSSAPRHPPEPRDCSHAAGQRRARAPLLRGHQRDRRTTGDFVDREIRRSAGPVGAPRPRLREVRCPTCPTRAHAGARSRRTLAQDPVDFAEIDGSRASSWISVMPSS